MVYTAKQEGYVVYIKLHGATKKCVRIDESDFSMLCAHKWYFSQGYATTNRHRLGCGRKDTDRNINVAMHRMLMGPPPRPGLCVDHINRDRLDNRRDNLRWVTSTQNARNSEGWGLLAKGVQADRGKYTARILGLHLGSYSTQREAALVYDKAARHYHGEYAYLNLPDTHYNLPVRYVDYTPDKHVPVSTYTGVSYFGHGGKRVKRWRSVFRKKTLGYYLTETEAATAYLEAKDCYESTKR